MRDAGDVGFSDVKRERGEAVGYVEYTNRDDMERALAKLDRSSFKWVPRAHSARLRLTV